MFFLTKRSEQKEIIDLGPAHYSLKEYQHCLEMLFRINRIFGFLNSTVRALKKLSPQSTVVDLGCGNGLALLHLSKKFPSMKFEGIEISHDAIHFAKRELKFHNPNNITFTHTPNKFDFPPNYTDIIVTTLVCHHFNDEEIIEYLQRSLASARKAVIINDLHRHIIPYVFFALTNRLLFRNRLISHDGLISIKRGFTYREWLHFLKKSKIPSFQIKWQFPFRWQIILWKK